MKPFLSNRSPLPLGEHLRELRAPVRGGGGEIAGFADILGEVVQLIVAVLEEADQLPSAVADGSTGSAALVAVVGLVRRKPDFYLHLVLGLNQILAGDTLRRAAARTCW